MLAAKNSWTASLEVITALNYQPISAFGVSYNFFSNYFKKLLVFFTHSLHEYMDRVLIVIKSPLQEYPSILKILEFILYVEFYVPRFQMFLPKYSRSGNFAGRELS